ncbi:MAG: bile acid:sodium symporter family protein [Muribaculaceae bacterium]|nr:bile acid:sodium symporter family protein [Muribaculaceae bacterium]
MNTIWIVLPILTLLMFELGLTLKLADFALFFKRPRPVLAGLLGQIVLLPAIAYGVATVFHLPPLFFIGVMLIACCPGGSSSNVFSMLARGDVALSVSLTALSSIITLFTVPLIMAFATAQVGASQHIELPVGNLVKQNLVLMLAPIVLGLVVKRYFPRASAAIDKVLRRIAFPAIILLATVFFITNKEAIIANFTTLGATVTVLLLLAMAGGVGMAWAMRLTGRERRTIVIEIGMQNAAQAIAIASSPLVFNDDRIAIPAIIYALMMNVVLIIYVALSKRVKE